MLRSFYENIPDLTIPSGAQDSEWLVADNDYSDANAIVIATPVGLLETVKLQTSFDGGNTIFDIETSDGSGLESLPAAGQSRMYFNLSGFPMLRIRATTAAAADRVFKLGKLWMT